MRQSNTALILVGLQNDYFGAGGVLREFLEDREMSDAVLRKTIALVRRLADTPVTIISTPILFTPDYDELVDPIGILAAIRDAGAFQRGAFGGQTVPELEALGDRILEVPGKRGLNAFSNTQLAGVLLDRGIQNVIFAGAVTSICIDSSARSAFEHGFKVTVLADCTVGRTRVEQDFYEKEIFPLYARVADSCEIFPGVGAADVRRSA